MNLCQILCLSLERKSTIRLVIEMTSVDRFFLFIRFSKLQVKYCLEDIHYEVKILGYADFVTIVHTISDKDR